MKIIIAPDKFKHSLNSEQIANAIYSGIKTVFPDSEIIKIPAADGGEGSAEIIAEYFNAKPVKIKVHNPVFKLITAEYYFSEKRKTSIIEMSAASGLHLLKPEEQNPMNTSTLGTGELISDAIKKGSTTIFLTLGGSATNDAGCGAAEALGYEFYNKNNKLLKITGRNLTEVNKISDKNIKAELKEIKFFTLYDVKNQLSGKNGAAYIYAEQKGANPKEIKHLDTGLKNISKIIKTKFKIDINNCEGCGAAGGFGAGSKAFFHSELKSGAETILDITDFENKIKNTDLIITGEGKFDTQSFEGKLTGTIIKKANKHNIPVVVVCGINEIKNLKTDKYSINLIISLHKKFPGTEEIKKNTFEKIVKAIQNTNFKIH